MDSFLDTVIIIKYIEYEYIKEQLRKKCFEHVKSSGKILISFLVKEELERQVVKRKEIYELVLKKIENSSFEIDYRKTAFLSKEDAIFAENLCLKLKGKSIEALKKEFDSEIGFLYASTALFLKNKVNEIAIKKSELNSFILSVVHDFIEDFADCRILTSAIQMQQSKSQFFFVTADRHIDAGSYDFVEHDIRLKDYKKPKLKNLLFAV